jgi:hypothetical protein
MTGRIRCPSPSGAGLHLVRLAGTVATGRVAVGGVKISSDLDPETDCLA